MANGRRRKGEGSVHKRKDGRWCGVVNLGTDAIGTRQRKYFYGATVAEVNSVMREFQRNIEMGIVETKESAISFGTFAAAWLEDVVKLRNRLRTHGDYEALINNHITPRIGRIALRDISPQTIQTLYGKMSREGVGGRTLQKTHVIVHQILKHAVRLGYLQRNVAEMVDKPKYKSARRPTLTITEIKKLLVISAGTWLNAAICVAAFTGMRQGELFGLHWRDVDFEGNKITIRNSLINHNGKREIGRTKTESSRRSIVMTNLVRIALEQQRERLKIAKLKYGATALVFPNNRGLLYDATNLRRTWNACLDAAEIERVHWHDLRHSMASNLLQLGAQGKVLQEILGHSSITVTMDIYGHVMPGMHEEAMRAFDRLEEKTESVGNSDPDLPEKQAVKSAVRGKKRPAKPKAGMKKPA